MRYRNGRARTLHVGRQSDKAVLATDLPPDPSPLTCASDGQGKAK